MLYMRVFLFLIFFSLTAYAKPLSIDNKTLFYDLLPSSQIYIDKTRSLDIENIKKLDDQFVSNDKKILGYGYSPEFDVWVKFTFKNDTDKAVQKIIEYANSMTTEVVFYDIYNNTVSKDGLLNMNKNRRSINPIFKIRLEAGEEKTYYIKASSYITTLIVKMNLWSYEKFYEKEIYHQLVLALFFGAMFILAIYNLFIYFFTKDISYLYYVLYIFGVIIHHTLYVGVAFIYLIPSHFNINIVENAVVFIMFPVIALAFFTKSFLNMKQYPKLYKILNVLVFLFIFSIVIFLSTDILNKYRNLFTITLLLYLIFVTLYAVYKKNRQAYFILFGWLMVFIAMLFMYLSSAGIFNVNKYSPYIVEMSLVLEAIIFSIALADRIKQLQQDKNEANRKLLLQQRNEKERLQEKVEEKTKDLTKALNEKGLLLKELNHRVKNNMQTIVSLLRLQGDELEDEKMNEIFTVVQNRINAMSHLHEILYQQDDISDINAYEYFDMVIDDLRQSYDKDINISFDIKTDLKMEQAIYCGLIVNELVTNSFKYAFGDNEGNIVIKLDKEEGKFKLYVSDDGVGYDSSTQSSDSLGMLLINTLAKEQLKGDIDIDSYEGVKVNITWSNNG